MARYLESKCKLCRREGIKLFLKSDRCYKEKCAIDKRACLPGQHGHNKPKISNYGILFREKQKLRRYHGLLEKQFYNYFQEASRKKGSTGKNLLELLERRLDNVVYRLGFALTRDQARQSVTHGHIMVNNHKVTIASYIVKKNDVISVTEKSRKKDQFINSVKFSQRVKLPLWLEVNTEKLEGKILSIPAREDVSLPVQEKLITELYS
ncbi:30S ribosomal protein S4 [Candidatus Desantisbacteria bacterium]|nr:30S ribosomal protein S4 [Candidatus Desantisbacteria bacterium]